MNARPHTKHSPPKPVEATSPASGTCSGGGRMGKTPPPSEPFIPCQPLTGAAPGPVGFDCPAQEQPNETWWPGFWPFVGDCIGAASIFVMLFGGLILGWAWQ